MRSKSRISALRNAVSREIGSPNMTVQLPYNFDEDTPSPKKRRSNPRNWYSKMAFWLEHGWSAEKP